MSALDSQAEQLKVARLRQERLVAWMTKSNLSKEEARAVLALRLDFAFKCFRDNPTGDNWSALENAMYEYQDICKNIK